MYKSTVIDLVNVGKTNEDNFRLQYPCMVVEGIEYTWEMEFFKNRSYNERLSIPLYVRFQGRYLLLTRVDLTSRTLMEFASISEGNYKVEIHKGENIKTTIDYMDGTTLEKFIKLGA